MTLADLVRASAPVGGGRHFGLLNLTALSSAAGWERTTLSKRIERGGPELTTDEQARIRQALATAGLHLDESY